MKIFVKCVDLGVSSVAIPTIGAGKHGYPEDVVLKIIRKVVERVSSEYSGKHLLRDVSVIVFKEKQLSHSHTTPSSYNVRRNSCSSPTQPSMISLFPNLHLTQQMVKEPVLPQPRQNVSSKGSLSAKKAGFTGLKFGLVDLVLKEGDITKQEADAILNVIPKSLKLSDGGGVCRSILKAGGQTIQDELDIIYTENALASVFVTSAGSIPNLKQIIHFLPTTIDVAGLQDSIVQCFNTAQLHSLNHLLIPAIGTANFNIPPRSSADLILNAAKKFSETNYSLSLEIVVFLKNILPDFETAMKNQTQQLVTVVALQNPRQPNVGYTVTEATDSEDNNNQFGTNTQNADNYSGGTTATAVQSQNGNDNHGISIGIIDEIELQFVGFKQNIDLAISDTKAFVDGIKDRKTIENIGDILYKHKSEVERLSSGLLIKCTASGTMTVEGLKGDVADFLLKFAELQKKYELDEQRKKLVSEISQYVQWSYLLAGSWVLYDEIINGEMELAFREDEEKKFDIIMNGANYLVDLKVKTKKCYASGQWFDLKRTAHAEDFPGIV